MGAVPCQLGLRERAFTFGPVIANLAAGAAAATAGGGKDAKKGKTAGDATPLLMPTGTGGEGGGRNGASASLKFTNPIKVSVQLGS